ncbi:hypothetical protein BJ508DRAFT_311661, partial [Ascobolus immersus RN42]
PVEDVASTRSLSKPTPGLLEIPTKSRSIQTSIVDALASGSTRQSSKLGTSNPALPPSEPTPPPPPPPQSRTLRARGRQNVVTRASSALTTRALPATQQELPLGLSKVEQDPSVKDAKDGILRKSEGVGHKSAPSATAFSPASRSSSEYPGLIPLEKGKVHHEASVSARHEELRVSTDDTVAGRLHSDKGSSQQTVIVPGADSAAPSSCFVDSPFKASSTKPSIDRSEAEQVDSQIKVGELIQRNSVPAREQTPGPYRQRTDDESCSESGSDEDARVADPFIDIVGIADDIDVEVSQFPELSPPCTTSADNERPTYVSAGLSLQPGISSQSQADQSSRIVPNATGATSSSQSFLAVNGNTAMPPASPPRGSIRSRNAIVPSKQTKLPPPANLTPRNTFLPLTSESAGMYLDSKFEEKVAAVFRSQVWRDSEWLRDVEDSLFTRLKSRLEEDSETGLIQDGFTAAARKRKYANTLSDVSSQQDNDALEVAQEPGKRIRLLDSVRVGGDGVCHGKHQEYEAKDKLIESLQKQNEGYRTQLLLLSERLKLLEGTENLERAPFYEVETSGSHVSSPKIPSSSGRFKSDTSVPTSTSQGNPITLPVAPIATSIKSQFTETRALPDIRMGVDAIRAPAKQNSGNPSRQSNPTSTTIAPMALSSKAVRSLGRPVVTDTRPPLFPRSTTPTTTSGPSTLPAATPRGRENGTRGPPTPTPTPGTPSARESRDRGLPSPAKAAPTRRIPAPSNSQTITPSRRLFGAEARRVALQPAAALIGSTTSLHTVGLSVKAPINIPSDDQELPAENDELLELYRMPTSQNDDTILKYLGMTEKDLIDETVGDGVNCGFKALARSILGCESMFDHLRLRAHEEFCKHEEFYMSLGWFKDDRSVEDLKRDLLGVSVPSQRNWYRNPIHTRMIANAFGGFIAVLERPDAKKVHIFGPSTSDKSEFFARLLTADEKPNRLYGICLVNDNHWKGFPLQITGNVKTREKLVRLHREAGLNPNLTVTMNWDGHMFVGSK